MDPEFWYQQLTLDSDAHRLNSHMIGIVKSYMRGEATTNATVHRARCAGMGTLALQGKFCEEQTLRLSGCNKIYACGVL
jgi:hypothetical protein